jgi:hypothetical protein
VHLKEKRKKKKKQKQTKTKTKNDKTKKKILLMKHTFLLRVECKKKVLKKSEMKNLIMMNLLNGLCAKSDRSNHEPTQNQTKHLRQMAFVKKSKLSL